MFTIVARKLHRCGSFYFYAAGNYYASPRQQPRQKAIVSHGDKDVTDRYRHVGLGAKREALEQLEQTYLIESV